MVVDHFLVVGFLVMRDRELRVYLSIYLVIVIRCIIKFLVEIHFRRSTLIHAVCYSQTLCDDASF